MERLGSTAESFPNGGLWVFSRDPNTPDLFVKRTGPHYLGGDHVWALSPDPGHAMWWGREATFYLSPLAREGWPKNCRPVSCLAVGDNADGVRDLWLEHIDMPSATSDVPVAIAALASWQTANQHTDVPWLAHDWIPTHIERRSMDNEVTLQHPGWARLVALGVQPETRRAVQGRITDGREAAAILDSLPTRLTHYDFHQMNIVTTHDGAAAITDWATVGWGPIGHDVGHLVIDAAANSPGIGIEALWSRYTSVYIDDLRQAGDAIATDVIMRSIALSNIIRQSWIIDHVLAAAGSLSDDDLARYVSILDFLARLHAEYVDA